MLHTMLRKQLASIGAEDWLQPDKTPQPIEWPPPPLAEEDEIQDEEEGNFNCEHFHLKIIVVQEDRGPDQVNFTSIMRGELDCRLFKLLWVRYCSQHGLRLQVKDSLKMVECIAFKKYFGAAAKIANVMRSGTTFKGIRAMFENVLDIGQVRRLFRRQDMCQELSQRSPEEIIGPTTVKIKVLFRADLEYGAQTGCCTADLYNMLKETFRLAHCDTQWLEGVSGIIKYMIKRCPGISWGLLSDRIRNNRLTKRMGNRQPDFEAVIEDCIARHEKTIISVQAATPASRDDRYVVTDAEQAEDQALSATLTRTFP